jgi:hypothetical protein
MIVHIGTGKTGSTAIQKSLSVQRHDLLNQGIFYWGLNLEYAPTSKKREWQQPGGIGLLQKMNAKNSISELDEVLEEALANTPDNSKIIWSNESIYEMSSVFQPEIRDLKLKHDLSLHLIAYARNLPSYILSAYKQWGVKHKTNRGAIQPFTSWVEQRKRFLSYPTYLESWDKAFPDEFYVFNYDAIDDVVSHFLLYSGLPAQAAPAAASERQYSTPDDIFLAIYALHNNRFSDSVLPTRVSNLLSENHLLDDNFILPSLASLYPTTDDLEEQSSFICEQTDLVNNILSRHNQPPLSIDLAEAPVSRSDESCLVNGILSILLALIIQQDNRIKHLEQSNRSRNHPLK